MATAEVTRRLIHAAGAIFPLIYLIDLVTWPHLQLIYATGAITAVALETLRLVVGFEWGMFDYLTRDYEQTNPAGYALYTLGSAAVILAFAPRIAVPAVLMLSIADPISGLLASTRPGRIKRPMVLLITFATCALLASPFVPLPAVILGAIVATVADGTTPVIAGYVIDDNVTIPIGAAIAMRIGLVVPV